MIPRRKEEKIFLLAVTLFAVVVLVWVSIQSIKTDNGRYVNTGLEVSQELDSKNYTFSKVEDEEKIWGTSKICNIYDYFEYEKIPLAYGQMLTLFGEPLYETENVENQFEYVISAVNEEGTVTYLTVYSGSTGPAIGGTEDGKEAADALLFYIRSAKAADYAYEGYYMDVPCRVKTGVKDGVPYSQEEALVLTDEEFSALYNRVYGLEN